MKTCAVSIDLDPIGHYYGLHGLHDPPADVLCTRGLARFLQLADEYKFKATLFVVAEELKRRELAELVRQAAGAGHEIANHTLSHRYDLTRMDLASIKNEIVYAHMAIADAAGRPPCGFRAPGYTLSPGLIAALEETGYLYDSSAFSSWPYWLIKTMVMGLSRIFGRRSAAIISPLSSLAAPTGPYRPDPANPYARGNARLVEIPISLSPVLRLPLIGTAFILAGPLLRRTLYAGIGARDLFNLEFHGIDFAGNDEVGAALLQARQPDARLPLAVKMARIRGIFEAIRGRDFTTLETFARGVGPALT